MDIFHTGLNPIPEPLGVFFLISQKLFLDDENSTKSEFTPQMCPLNTEIDDVLMERFSRKWYYLRAFFYQLSPVAGTRF